jgi:hypothetical protein
MDERCESFAERHWFFAVEERHELAVSPHCRLAPEEGAARPVAGSREIVAGEQRRATAAQMVTLSRVEERRSAGNGALEMAEVRHYLPSSSVSFFF